MVENSRLPCEREHGFPSLSTVCLFLAHQNHSHTLPGTFSSFSTLSSEYTRLAWLSSSSTGRNHTLIPVCIGPLSFLFKLDW